MGRISELFKLEGIGNDFLVALVDEPISDLEPQYVRLLCNRHRGLGADGLIVSALIAGTAASASMLLYNADGTRAEMSGNGIRCLAHALVRSGLVTTDRFVISTDAGLKEVVFAQADNPDHAMVEVGMGEVAYLSAPFGVQGRFEGVDFLGSELDVGNPHLIFLPRAQVEGGAASIDLDHLDLGTLGPMLESRYPQGSNIEWLDLDAQKNTARMRVWERGAGITQACGTGSAASAFLLIDQGLVGGEVTIDNPGGALKLRRNGDNGEMLLVGESRFVAMVEPASDLCFDY